MSNTESTESPAPKSIPVDNHRVETSITHGTLSAAITGSGLFYIEQPARDYDRTIPRIVASVKLSRREAAQWVEALAPYAALALIHPEESPAPEALIAEQDGAYL